MITTIGLVLWSVLVLGIIGCVGSMILKSINSTLNRDYKYAINIDKKGFKLSNLPFIKLKIRGKYRYFLIDSGASVNLLSEKAMLKDSNFKDTANVIGSDSVLGVGSSSEDTPITIPIVEETISFKGDKFKEEFRLSDSWESIRDAVRKESGIEVYGLLGSPFIAKAKWVLDLEDLVVWVRR